MKNIFILFIIFSFNSFAEEELKPIFHIFQYNDYQIKLIEHPEMGASGGDELIIFKENKELLHIEYGISSIRQGYNLDKVNENTPIKSPILVIDEYSGGAHCCFGAKILELGSSFKVIAEFYGGSFPIELIKQGNESEFEVRMCDETYTYVWTSFATSPSPQVILLLQDGKYKLFAEVMKKEFLDDNNLNILIKEINSEKYPNFKYFLFDDKSIQDDYTNELYLSKVLRVVLDLIYSGRSSQAWTVIDKTWPSNDNSKNQFINDIKFYLKKSPYYEEIIKMNNSDKMLLNNS